MYKISLINMPFASLNMASMALTYFKSIVEEKFSEKVSMQLLYLNFDFSDYFTYEKYEIFLGPGHSAGLGDWIFRPIAFPNAPDNTEEYFAHYFPESEEKNIAFKKDIIKQRDGLNDFMDNLIEKYQLGDSDLVGMTSMFTQNVPSLAMAKKIKDKNKNIITIMGGANCESPMGEEIIKNVDYLDYVFSGPSLKSFPDFLQYCLNNDMEKCEEIKGVFSKKKSASRQPQQIEVGADVAMDSLSTNLNYNDFLDTFEKHFTKESKIFPMLPFMTSTGCWWGERSMCTFCGLNSSTIGYKAMSPAKAIEQFEHLFKHSSRCSFLFCVDNILPISYLKEVFPKLNPPENSRIFYEIKASMKKDEMDTLAKAHVQFLQPGIEAVSTPLLKLMKKGTSAFGNINFLKYCIEFNIFPIWNLLVGFPGQEEKTYEDYMDNLPLLAHLPPPNAAFPIRYDRYSPYYNMAKEHNLDLSPHEFYGFVYPFSKESLANIAYFFKDDTPEADYKNVLNQWLPHLRDKIKSWLQMWYGSEQRPKLFFKEEDIVFDSRSGEEKEYKINPIAKKILKYLENRALDIPQIVKKIQSESEDKIKQEFSDLAEKGLLFQEDGRFVSLVLPQSPPALTSYPTSKPNLY